MLRGLVRPSTCERTLHLSQQRENPIDHGSEESARVLRFTGIAKSFLCATSLFSSLFSLTK